MKDAKNTDVEVLPATTDIPFFSASSSAMPCSAAYLRTSSVIFIEQKCGPHMEQKCAVFAPSCGRVSSWNSRAVTGSRLRLN